MACTMTDRPSGTAPGGPAMDDDAPDVFGPDVSRWRTSVSTSVSGWRVGTMCGNRALRCALSVPTTRHRWVPEDAITFTPPLADVIYGDGRALLGLTTCCDRAAFWLVRIDSGWDIGWGGAPFGAPLLVDHVELVVTNLAAEFGNGELGYWDDGPDDDGDLYPVIDARDGYAWAWHDGPRPSVRSRRTPYRPATRIAAEG